jgi:hypothetical protein
MSTPKADTLSVTSNKNHFSWRPTRYPIGWAETPSDVPVWDISRGVEPNNFMSGGYDHAHVTDMSTLQRIKYLTAESDEVLKGFSQVAKDAYQHIDAYPRLVAKAPMLGASLPAVNPKRNMLGQLARAADIAKSRPNLFKDRILNLALEYAMLDPCSQQTYYGVASPTSYSNTLEAWRDLCFEAAFWLEFIKVAQEHRDKITTLKELVGITADMLPRYLKPDTGIGDGGVESLQLAKELKPDSQNYERYFLNMWVQAKKKMLGKEVLKYMAGVFFERFEQNASFQLRGGELTLVSGASVWFLCELARACEGADGLKQCGHCHKMFFPTRVGLR